MSKVSHEERTAAEPRDPSLHAVEIGHVDQVGDSIRVFRLKILEGNPPIKFLPGQWVDTFCPGIPGAGGFSITSPPSAATDPQVPPADPGPEASSPTAYRYVELAVRRADDSPATAFLWRDRAAPGFLLGTPLRLRVGGSFVYPPPGVLPSQLRRLVLVAGGVGVNPLASIAAHLAEQGRRRREAGAHIEVTFLYSLRHVSGEKKVDEMLFVERLAGFFGSGDLRGHLRLFLTPGPYAGGGGDADEDGEQEGVVPCGGLDVPYARRRIVPDDIVKALGPDSRFAAVYVCGVPKMTDDIVRRLLAAPPEGVGMEKHRVLYEKWW